MKKVLLAVVALVMAVSLIMAAEMKETVVKDLLPDSDMKAQVFNVSEALVAKVQAGLGNKMPVRPVYEIYVSKTGAVVIEEQMGKWGPIKMAMLIDPLTKKLKSIGYISMSEKRGAGIKQANFVKQFIGKTSADTISVGKDITGISGATISSKAVSIAVKRALIIYEAFTAKK
jgi:electron transport complex protein RnfG